MKKPDLYSSDEQGRPNKTESIIGIMIGLSGLLCVIAYLILSYKEIIDK